MIVSTKKQLEQTLKILSELVAFPVLGGESNLSIATYIQSVFERNGITCYTAYNNEKNKVALHCRIGPGVDGGLILSGHMDVVPTEGQQWTRPDFQTTHEGDRIYGRGTTDMKGFLACCLAMLPVFNKAALQKPIYLAFSFDEEVGCLGGPTIIEAIQKTYSENPSFVVVGEPTSMQPIIAEKGVAFFQTKIFSEPAHSSQVCSTVSTITEATYLIQWLQEKMETPIGKRLIDPRFDPPFTTIHVGVIKGGVAANIIADYCEFEWDVRNIPSESIEDIISDFKSYCATVEIEKQKTTPGFKICTNAKFPIVPGLITSEYSEIVSMLHFLSDTASTGTVSFASEAGQFSQAGFQTVLCGPGNMEQGHGVDEYIEIGELQHCLVFLNKLTHWASQLNKNNNEEI